jgi:TRAP-type C4-dicarboxylate transport system substrate-binding protein
VDAVAAGASFGIGQGMADVTSYLNIWGFEPIFPVVLVANVKSFEALPADLQQILRNLSREWQARMFTGGDSVSRLALSLGAAAGLKLVSPEKAQVDRAITLTAGVVDKWLGLTGADGKAAMSIISEYASGAKRAK